MRLAFPNLCAPPLHERSLAQHWCADMACSLSAQTFSCELSGGQTCLQFWPPRQFTN